MIPTEVSKESPWILQFSVYVHNKVGGLHRLISLLGKNGPTLLSISTLDHQEGSIVRLIFDYPALARGLFEEHDVAYCVSEVIGVRMPNPCEFLGILSTLAEAEVNLFYTYPLLIQTGQACVLILSTEDSEFSSSVLSASGFTVLRQNDLTR